MALTISETFRWSAGGRAFRCYDITHDGSVLSISAASMDLDYIEAIVGHSAYLSMDVPTSELMGVLRVSINAAHSGVTWAETEANGKSHLTVVGW